MPPVRLRHRTADHPARDIWWSSSAWSAHAGLVVQSATVDAGKFAAEGNTTTGNTYAKKTLPGTYPDGYAQVAFDIVSQASQVNLLRLRSASGASLGYAYVDGAGHLGYHNDALGTNATSSVVPGAGWHSLELRRLAEDTAGTATGALQLWLDNSMVDALSSTSIDVGLTPVGAMQIGETQSGRSYDVVFDDAAFGTSWLGPTGGTTAPSSPAPTATTSPPPPPPPVTAAAAFADGFESGNLSAWTTSRGVVAESAVARTGGFGAQASTSTGATYAKKTLSAAYSDGYARVAFRVVSQASQLNLLRLRTASGASMGYVFLNSAGRLGLHLDGPKATIVSTLQPDASWHVVELHLDISTGTVEVWLDGTAVPALGGSGKPLGAAPVGVIQIGETQSGRTYDVIFDDAAFGATRIGLS